MLRNPSPGCWVLAACGLLAGCNRSDVQVYDVAKPQASASQTQGSALPPGHPEIAPGAPRLPGLKYELPPGWKEAPPGEMRAASFRIQDSAGKQADLGVVPLPGLMGRDLETVNRWRTTVGLPEVKEEELAKLAEKVEIAGLTADLYDQGGENPGSGEKARILAAILRKDNVAWFFKMAGDDQLVAKEKPAFISFLKSVSFTASAAPMPAPNMSSSALPASHPPIDGVGSAPPTAAAQNRPAWEVPAGWKEAPAGQFLVAKYLVAEGTNAQAAVNVSMSSGTGGGVAGNVNRWRGQLGLGELPEAEVSKLVSPLEGSAGAVSVDLAGSDPRTGGKTRLVAAIIPRGDVTWFYKLMGNEQLVQREKDAFLSFVRSAKYN